MTFQKKVLVISVIILIGTLALIGYMLHKAQGSTTYPPEISMCPDFWEVTQDGKSGPIKCRPNPDLGADGNVGDFQGSDFDFNKPQYRGPKGREEKKKWATDLKIYWDGITDMYEPKKEGDKDRSQKR